MLEKIKKLLNLDYFNENEDEPVQHSGSLIDIRTLQAQVRELQEVIRKQNAIMRELSEDNTNASTTLIEWQSNSVSLMYMRT